MFSQVRYCCAHLLNYGTGIVPYCTVLRPLSCLYSTSTCTTVLHSYRTLLQILFSVLVRVLVEVQYSTVTYRTYPQVRYCCAHLLNYSTGTVPHCTVLRPLSCLYLYEYATVLYCTVLYSYRTLFQTIFSVLVRVHVQYRSILE